MFNNLRASRATELEREFPSRVAAAWLGHSEKIADEHYRMTLDQDFAKAVGMAPEKAVQKVTQQPSEQAGNDQKLVEATNEKSSEFPSFSEPCGYMHGEHIAATGLEPVTRGL